MKVQINNSADECLLCFRLQNIISISVFDFFTDNKTFYYLPLTFSQTSPGFYVSAVQVCRNTGGKGEIALYKQFLAPLAIGQQAYVMFHYPSCISPCIHLFVHLSLHPSACQLFL